MTSQNQESGFAVPDLSDLPLDKLADLGDSALARSLALYQRRREDNGPLYSAFNATIEV